MKTLAQIYLSIVSLSVCATPAVAQQGVCSLKLSQAPELRGFRLGMRPGQVTARYPGIQIRPADEYGVVNFSSDNPSLINAAAFKGVSSISLEFIDERLTRFTVEYDHSTPWDRVDQFIRKVSAAINLPDSWPGAGDHSARLFCDGFEVYASVYPVQVTFTEIGATNIIKKRVEEKRERLRQAFKP